MADLDSRLLRAFVAVAEEFNFTRAADRLHLAQQALSAQIQQLELRVGERLFDRTTRSVALTEAGERLLPHARAVIAALDAGLGELEATRRGARATLRVGLATTAVVPLVGETLRRFGADRPDVHLAVSNHGMIDPSAGLRAGTVDVGFVRPPFTDDGLVEMKTPLTEPRYIVLREGHPLAERESVRPRDVGGEPWIYVEGADPKTRAFWSLEEFRDEPLRTGTRVNSFEEAFAAVLAGLAITCQGESAIRTVGAAFPQLRPVRLEGVEPARVAVAWRAREETDLTPRSSPPRWPSRLTTGSGESQRNRCFTFSRLGRRVPAMQTTLNTPTPYVSHLPDPVWYGNSLFEFLVPAEASGGTISVFRTTFAAGFSPPRHVHTREDEVFLVEAGDVTFWIDGREVAAGPGTTVHMPRGVPHTFRVDSDGAVILGVMTPGHFESLFRELGVPAQGRTLPPPGEVPFDVARVMAAQEQRGTRVVGPPLAPPAG